MSNNRYFWLDNIRSLACLMVILLHTVAGYLYQLNSISIYSWQVGNIIDSFTRISVPLFFMISGYLFFRNKKPKFHNFLKIITAILFYSLIYIGYIYFLNRNYPSYANGIGANISTSELLVNMIYQPVFYHLWFFYSIIIIYFFSYLIRVRDDVESIGLMIVCGFLFFWFNPMLNLQTPLNSKTLYYILFGILGAYLGVRGYKGGRLMNFIILMVFIASSLFIAYMTNMLSIENGYFNDKYYQYSGIPVIIGAISIFILFKKVGNLPNKIQKISNIISSYSLGIYGIHALFLSLFDIFGLRNYNYPILDIIITFTVCTVLSLIFAICVRYFDKKSYIS